ncbi:MAG: chemotaxis protein CheA [Geobacteraceae bacterium]|nr:chemotaxis protein CheA [Geobacteraceae bacterium]
MDNKIDISILLEDYLEDASGHLDAVETILLQLENSSGEGERDLDGGAVTILLGTLHTLKGNSGMMGLTPMQQFVHRLESALKSAADSSLAITPVFFEAFFTAVNAMRDAVNKLADDPAAPLDFSDELMLLECLTVKEAGSWDAPLAPGKRDDFSSIIQKSGTLKVNFGKLDELMNLVGELVIHRTALLSLESRLRETVRDRGIIDSFDESSQAIGKIANDLREAIMKVRMLPIKTVFHRFHRLVRDLSRRHGKEVRLVCEGEETEIDKTVIDEIGEPLLHLIRNGVDHGIEAPGVRTRGGKPAAGVLKLTAGHQNNQIVITVEDDGRGMSVERLKASAIEKGLLDGREAGSLTDLEAFQLVFLPGFSTSNELTETSGRGIGLDVVRKTVASFNGVIDIESTAGKGTRFTIRLPLTLAIITALMVEVSGETFAIPLSAVLESIRIDSAEIHQVSSGELIKLRDRLLPVVRLDRYFGLPEAAGRETEYVVVVGSGERQGGIVVDRLIGQQEIVIKGMDDYLGELPGISGGTVLGDGRISLIIDVASIIGKAKR